MKKWISFVSVLCLLTGYCQADEGMWIPMLLKKYNIEDMQKKGFRLTAEDVYDINKASLKDAVVGLGREGSPFHHFCTGEFISAEGLLVTNPPLFLRYDSESFFFGTQLSEGWFLGAGEK